MARQFPSRSRFLEAAGKNRIVRRRPALEISAAGRSPLAPGVAYSYAVLSMARKPRILTTEAELYTAAIGALARRSHSVREMRQYLERRSDDRATAASVLSRLRAEGLVDDARYARQFARDRSANRRQGPFRIARELRARGVADTHIAPALEELASQTDESAMIRRRIEIWLRRHAVADPSVLDRAQTASLYQNLLRAGFPGDRIRAELRRHGDPSSAVVDEDEEGE